MGTPNVTARLRVSRVSTWGPKDGEWTNAEVEMTPDYADGKNKEWSEATPAGVLRLTMKRSVAELFPEGRTVEIVISDTPTVE